MWTGWTAVSTHVHTGYKVALTGVGSGALCDVILRREDDEDDRNDKR